MSYFPKNIFGTSGKCCIGETRKTTYLCFSQAEKRRSCTLNILASMTIGEAVILFQRLGGNIVSMTLDNNNPTEHTVNHKFRETMIVPLLAVSNNCSFIMGKGEHHITTADGIRCKVMSWEEKHICELENKIYELYGIDVWSFIKRWYKSNNNMDSMHFLIINLKQDEGIKN